MELDIKFTINPDEISELGKLYAKYIEHMQKQIESIRKPDE